MAAALDVIGDRWALLVVRDLILGPQRFTDLMAGLKGISTDILTARLRALEAAGIVRRAGAAGRQHYQLTATGRRLRPVLAELGRWGAFLLSPPSRPEDVATRVALTTLVLDPRAAPAKLHGQFRINVADQSARLSVDGGRVAIRAEPPDSPSRAEPGVTVIKLSRSGLLKLLAGRSGRELAADGGLSADGDHAGAVMLLDTLAAPPVLAGIGLGHHD